MWLEQVVQQVEQRLGYLFAEEVPEEPRRPAEDVAGEMAACREALREAREQRTALVTRLEEGVEELALMPSRIESSVQRGKASQALRQAIELERRRQAAEQDRLALPRVEQLIWSLEFRLKQLARKARATGSGA